MIFVFLKCCLGNEVDMKTVVSRMDWRQLYAFAQKQAIVGFCFEGIERLGNEYPEELKRNPIGQDLLMEWMGKTQQIRRQNMKVNMVAGKLFAQLRKDGLRCCVLKGQGNALMYPNPYSRNPGDIDVWVNAERDSLTEYAKKHFELGDDVRYHHLVMSMDGVPVELHFIPGIMNIRCIMPDCRSGLSAMEICNARMLLACLMKLGRLRCRQQRLMSSIN